MNSFDSGYIARALGVIADQQPNLRDQFATAALAAIVSNHLSGMERPEQDAALAYEYADAMMEARDAKR